MKKQYIICSAIHFDDGKNHVHQPKNITSGFVVAGRRHHNCYFTVAVLCDGELSYKNLASVQGFLTNDDLFVSRHEAFLIAREADQLLLPAGENQTLLSEDIF